ncbi:MAG: poly-beta-1,6-N-acetyl-D-glucosamine biosynthesis protein PgaD [Methylococcales bacterium]|nr:poly-beta-1,6-N-acetyl-D-glucosamine biosynthesis protein PgaD [Methylococcales bacterium]
MKAYIINAPQLQSLQKRLGAFLAWLICWAMWIYLLIPLVTLTSWVLGDKKMINEMRWFGGYKSLLELLQIYLMTLLVMAGLWFIWVIYRTLLTRVVKPATQIPVSDKEICEFYQVKNPELQNCRHAQLVTVFYDDQGHIVELVDHISS